MVKALVKNGTTLNGEAARLKENQEAYNGYSWCSHVEKMQATTLKEQKIHCKNPVEKLTSKILLQFKLKQRHLYL